MHLELLLFSLTSLRFQFIFENHGVFIFKWGAFLAHAILFLGAWTATDAGIGAGVDSYFEYLAKGALLFHRPRLMHQFNSKCLVDHLVIIMLCFIC